MNYYQKICSLKDFFEEPSANCFYPDIQYYLLDEDGNMFGGIFHILTSSRNGAHVYFTDDAGYPQFISEEELPEFSECYIAKMSEEISELNLILEEFKPSNYSDESRDWKMGIEIMKLRKMLKENVVVNNVVQNVQLPTSQNNYVYSDRTPIDGFDPNKPWSWVCNGCGAREYTSCVDERSMDNISCSSCGDDEWHRETIQNHQS